MIKIFVVIGVVFFATLAVITAVETVNSPKLTTVNVETRADRRKKARG